MLGVIVAQSRPSDTTTVSVYSPDTGDVMEIIAINVANTSAAAVNYRVFHDEDGTTYDESTALYFDVSLAANTTDTLEPKIWMRNSSGNLAVRTSSANDLTFTIYGILHNQ